MALSPCYKPEYALSGVSAQTVVGWAEQRSARFFSLPLSRLFVPVDYIVVAVSLHCGGYENIAGSVCHASTDRVQACSIVIRNTGWKKWLTGWWLCERELL